MSTFMAFACLDLASPAALEPFLSELRRGVADERDASQPLAVWVTDRDDAPRLLFFADYGNIWLGRLLVQAGEATGGMRRAVLALDHDEYGVEHIVLDGRGGRIRRVHHVYVYPGGQPNGEGPTLGELPAADGLTVGGDATVDGESARAAAAALFGVAPERMERAAVAARAAHQNLMIVFTPFAHWWEALDVPYPGNLDAPPAIEIGRA